MSAESVAHLNVVAQKSWRRQVSCFRFAGAFHDEGMTAFPKVKNEEGGEGGEEKGEEEEQALRVASSIRTFGSVRVCCWRAKSNLCNLSVGSRLRTQIFLRKYRLGGDLRARRRERRHGQRRTIPLPFRDPDVVAGSQTIPKRMEDGDCISPERHGRRFLLFSQDVQAVLTCTARCRRGERLGGARCR